jgi:hypothetical protein
MTIRRSSGYDPGADLRGDSKGEFCADLLFGETGEITAQSILEALSSGWVEVKSDGFENGNLFIEVAHCPSRKVDANGDFIWTKSGLNTTQAKYYMYLKQSESGMLRGALVLETERLRRFHRWVKDTKGLGVSPAGFKGTCYLYGNLNGEVPTIGLRIVASDLEMLLSSSKFD